MIVLYLFSLLVQSKSTAAHYAGMTLTWAVVLVLIIFMGFTTSVVAFDWPCNWAIILKFQQSCDAPKLTSSAPASSPPNSLALKEQFDTLNGINSFFGGKDEMGLRTMFDLPNVLNKNIGVQVTRLTYIHAGKEGDFYYNNYTDNGSLIFWAKEGHFAAGPSGVHVIAGPQDVLYLVTTSKFQEAQKAITEFTNSALVTEDLKKEISSFNDVINKNTELMLQILDQRMHQDERFFINNMDMGTPYYGVIVNDYARRAIALKPARTAFCTQYQPLGN